MADIPTTLYGRPVSPSRRLSLTDQIYDIIREEIASGRWRLGDRLPSISSLAEESGISGWPVQQAFERLREEGILAQRKGSGTYLASLLPRGHSPRGAIGVVAPRQGASSPEFNQWRLHEILSAAADRSYLAEVRYFDANEDPGIIAKIGGLFSSQVQGLISLMPFDHYPGPELPPDHLPLVFLEEQDLKATPAVNFDLRHGAYMITRRLLELGHREIAPCFGPETRHMRRVADLLLEGHSLAMREAGLRVDKEAVGQSMDIAMGDLAGLNRFLDEHSASTALLGVSPARAREIIGLGAMRGVRTPRDLSLVSFTLRTAELLYPELGLSGVGYDFEHALRMCFEMLLEQMETRRIPVTALTLRGHLVEGKTLGPPRPAGIESSSVEIAASRT